MEERLASREVVIEANGRTSTSFGVDNSSDASESSAYNGIRKHESDTE